MPVTVHNPYSKKDEETCSVSFAAQQKVVSGVSSQQTEGEFAHSKLMGELGVIQGKLTNGQIANGTKVVVFSAEGVRGYFYVKNGELHKKAFTDSGNLVSDVPSSINTAKLWTGLEGFTVTIPKASPAGNTDASPVNSGSSSAGSMSHEDVAAMFVKIKDDLAKEKGLNIKGANPELDQVVYQAIGDKTGYTADEVKGKIDAYKADGNKLSALKKKVLLGTKKVPDPKPNGVPTKVTDTVTAAAKEVVVEKVEAQPAKVYSDEDIAAAYIIAKDFIVATNTKGWTLYTKNEEMDAHIALKIKLKTGLTAVQQKQAIANYLGSGKKLSQLKKSLAKQGAFTPQADTLKKSGADKVQADKEKDIAAKADAGYTPTPTPAVAGIATGKPAPKRVEREAEQAGSIEHITNANQLAIYQAFKSKGNASYLSSTNQQTYDALAAVQTTFQANGQDYTLLQLLRVIDNQGAIKFKAENGKLFEKKVATWLTSPDGTAHIKANEVKLAKMAEQAKANAEAAKLAKKLENNQPPLPPDSALFQDWELEKAKRVSATWLEAKPWTAKEKSDLKHYTGSSYVEMNGYLRSQGSRSISERSRKAIQGAKEGMRPTTEPILVKRGTGLEQFESLGVHRGSDNLVWSLTGRTFKDEGFLSTSAGGRAAFSGAARLEIECPVGTPMAYVAPISKYPSENEMLLQAGMEYKVLNIRKEGNTFVVRMRVVNWPGKG